jgi:alkanesulfonate monooxygenase SsuD/methylene tetrahydromethanopterin reductase-like flavin-dependent oxidoreductase (luciferase family)
MAGPGTFISVGRSLDQAIERVRRADTLGYDSVYVTHIAGRDSLTVLMAYAAATKRIRLGTGVLPMYSRTPVATAQQAATIDEYSGGRMVLGIGVSHQVTVENWFGSRIEHPVAEMREYATALRAMFEGRDVPEGKRFPTRFRFMGFKPRPALPIYIAGLSPNMLRLAGEIADGVMLWLCNPEYIEAVVVPSVREGRERAGKTLDGFDVVAAVPAAVTDDRAAAYEVMRGDLLTYWGLPFYRAMIERSGFGEDIAAFDAAMDAGDIDKAKQAISDRFLEALTAIGSPDQVRAGIVRYRDAGATSPCVGPVPRTDFAATLEAAAP